MRRRDFLIAVLATASTGRIVRAQIAQNRPARIGFLRASPPPERILAAFRRGLAEHGYQEGSGFVLIPGWADGDIDRLPALAAALVAADVDVILADGAITAVAARAATAAIPIIMAGGRDPVRDGLVQSLSRPGGNVTGFTTQVIDVTGKMFELLLEISPGIRRVAIINPVRIGSIFRAAEAEAAQRLGLALDYINLDGVDPADAAMRKAMEVHAGAAIIRGTPFLSTPQRKAIVERAAAYRMPAMYETRDFVDLGGLLSYGGNFDELFRLAADYVDKILNGARPADLPVEQSTNIELVINLKTAKALGLVIPPALLARADEVIE